MFVSVLVVQYCINLIRIILDCEWTEANGSNCARYSSQSSEIEALGPQSRILWISIVRIRLYRFRVIFRDYTASKF